jgi:hypothetical protein
MSRLIVRDAKTPNTDTTDLLIAAPTWVEPDRQKRTSVTSFEPVLVPERSTRMLQYTARHEEQRHRRLSPRLWSSRYAPENVLALASPTMNGCWHSVHGPHTTIDRVPRREAPVEDRPRQERIGA